jgi:hypothetical protein
MKSLQLWFAEWEKRKKLSIAMEAASFNLFYTLLATLRMRLDLGSLSVALLRRAGEILKYPRIDGTLTLQKLDLLRNRLF